MRRFLPFRLLYTKYSHFPLPDYRSRAGTCSSLFHFISALPFRGLFKASLFLPSSSDSVAVIEEIARGCAEVIQRIKNKRRNFFILVPGTFFLNIVGWKFIQTSACLDFVLFASSNSSAFPIEVYVNNGLFNSSSRADTGFAAGWTRVVTV